MQIFAETPRLILREILPQDEEGLYALDSNPEVHRYLGNKPLSSKAEVINVINFVRQQYIDNGIGRWAMIEKDTNFFIGWAGLKLIKDTINHHTHFYDLGYRLIQDYWGLGYATEAAKASLDYGFNTLNLATIYAMADCNNKGSNSVLQKSGLSHIETFDYEGRPHNWFSIEKSKG
jgi:[ribosomal protein S5]-alanine N-acetyltransferase